MKILIACEESQEVCKSFRNKGHEAFSCDILDCSGQYPKWHIKDDVFNIINDNWDMMIAFPPCTHLASSGAAHFKKKIQDGRQEEAINFFMKLVNSPIKKICIENPIGIMSKFYRKPDQIIQPYFFGDNYKKSTCLWLKNLPLLKYTNVVGKGSFYISKSGKRMPSWSHDTVGADGKKLGYNTAEIKKIRNKTFQGIADAMANQWGKL
jgi:site-specific DNA-cytosine methylase